MTACLDPAEDTEELGEKLPAESSGTEDEPALLETEATLQSVVDGDTVKTSEGTVRIIGIDTPERGECGYEEAARLISDHIGSGDSVILGFPDGQNDTDRHGRLLRTLTTTDGLDVGRAQLEAGNAVARYDSRDGYPSHPDENLYRSLDTATLSDDGRVVTTSCAEAAALAAEVPTQEPTPPAADSNQWTDGAWYTKFRSCAALKRDPQGNPTGPFNRDVAAEREAYNWFQYGTGHHGDGDGDGLACE